MNRRPQLSRYVICVRNRGYRASLERGKVYRVRKVVDLGGNRLFRIKDELDDLALYPDSFFMPIPLAASVRRALSLAG